MFSFLTIFLLKENFLVEDLSFLSFDYSINLNNYSLIFTTFCLVIFFNALNMYDGVNGQAIIYSLIIFFVLLLKGFEFYFCIGLILFSLLFLILNLNNKTFLGDNGIFVLSIIISLLIIKSYNDRLLYVDEIFLLMILPGVDMLRLFILRILKKKSPLVADREHLHHYLIEKFNNNISLLILSILSILPFIIFKFTNYYFSISFFIISYIFLILLKKK